MITQKIKNLFQFIEFLHSNIDNFNEHNDLISELLLLNREKQSINPDKNYKDRLKYNEIQTQIETKFEVLKSKIVTPIKSKAKELNICDFSNEPLYKWYGVESDLRQLTKNFNTNDLKEILKYKNQYIEYRTNTHESFLSLQFFFDELDEITKVLFDYFKDVDHNEYKNFEVETKKADTINELTELAKQGYKVEIPIHSVFNHSNDTKTKKTKQPSENKEKQEPPAEHLKDLFEDKNLYDKVIDILIDENYIEKGTLIWKDETNGRNTFVAGLIKVLYNKGYLSRKAKNKEIPLISKNTFNVVLSKSIAEKTKVNDNDKIYKFIPIVTELK